jgi:ATP-binding cassette subfamily B protein
VVLVEGGRVIADGTHESLLATEPRYGRVLASLATESLATDETDEVAA